MAALDRRAFLKRSAGALTGAVAAAAWAQQGRAAASERVRMGCIGVGGRAGELVRGFAGLKEVEIVTLCDIDSRRLPAAVEAVAKHTGKTPATVGDFRKIIDDRAIDAVAIGTPDHWHAIPTILACLAGKDVYVEKPDGHNLVEGQRMVAAMRKEKRIVQLGTQSRSSRHFLDAIEYLKSGKLGRCLFAKAWESGKQGSIGRPPDGAPPQGVDYDTWLGPAPKRPFNPVRFHGNWRWFFDYGTGDLGNDGVHRLDVARWALSAAMEGAGEGPLPPLSRKICASGGKWYFDDAQEWPDTLQVNYEYEVPGKAGRVLTYEMRIWNPYPYLGEGEGAAVFGDKGWIIVGNGGWRAFGNNDEKLVDRKGGIDDSAHMQNFIDCIKSRKRPNADLETVGHASSVLCHAGNVAWRTGRKLTLDAQTELFVGEGSEAANKLRTRPEYRKPWVLPEV